MTIFGFMQGNLVPLNFLNGCGLIMLSMFVMGAFDFCMGRREFSAAFVSVVTYTAIPSKYLLNLHYWADMEEVGK
jgi:hypothetical protein